MATAMWLYTLCLTIGLLLFFVSGLLGWMGSAFSFGDTDVGAGGLDVHADGLDVHTDGFDVHADSVDVSPDVEAGATIGPVSGPIISTLLSGFGIVGIVCTKFFQMPPMLSAPISALTAIAASIAVFYALSKLLLSLQGTSHTTLASVVGTDAQVVSPIPADGVGMVAYSHGGVRDSRPARSEEGVLIPQHSLVRITRVAGATLIVHELVDERLRRLKDTEEGEADGSEK
ncbi:MAG: NfeD family protein [Armatimonadota bacterium]